MCHIDILPVDEMSAVMMHPELQVEIQAFERVFVLEQATGAVHLLIHYQCRCLIV